VKIDFGCGPSKLPGYTGLDLFAWPGVDVVCTDGMRIPLPDDSVSEVYTRMCLEHVTDIFAVMNELWRVCEPGALIRIEVPHSSLTSCRDDLDHKRTFTFRMFEYHFGQTPEPSIQMIAGRARFDQQSVRLVWWNPKMIRLKVWWKRTILNALSVVINGVANVSPFLCERLWCSWVGGFDEIHFVLKVVK
jgi:hypothetical protein